MRNGSGRSGRLAGCRPKRCVVPDGAGGSGAGRWGDLREVDTLHDYPLTVPVTDLQPS